MVNINKYIKALLHPAGGHQPDVIISSHILPGM